MSRASAASVGTQSDHVYDFLQPEILSCRLAPSTKIRINEIALRLGVSLGAVREALSRLAGEGLVVTQAQKGYTVAPVSKDELTDLTATRVAIEELCLTKAIEHGDVEWEAGIVAAFHRLHRIPERDSKDDALLNEAWATAHGIFHLAIVSGCASPSMLRVRAGLYAQSERYRRLSLPLRRTNRNVDAEHEALTSAVLSRRRDEACSIMSEHLWRTTNILLSAPILDSDAFI